MSLESNNNINNNSENNTGTLVSVINMYLTTLKISYTTNAKE